MAKLKRERVNEVEKLEKKMKMERDELREEMKRKETKWEEEKKLLWEKILKLENGEFREEEMEVVEGGKEEEKSHSWSEIVRRGKKTKTGVKDSFGSQSAGAIGLETGESGAEKKEKFEDQRPEVGR